LTFRGTALLLLGGRYKAGIWRERKIAIGFMLGCGCLPGQTIIATHQGPAVIFYSFTPCASERFDGGTGLGFAAAHRDEDALVLLIT